MRKRVRHAIMVATMAGLLMVPQIGGISAAVAVNLHPVTPATPIRIYLDGQPLNTDVLPVLLNNRTMLPIRAVAESLGMQVAWTNNGTIQLTKGGLIVGLSVGSDMAKVNGTAVSLDAPAIVAQGRTMVPVRFVAEQLNCTLNWDGATSTVRIAGPASAAPAATGTAAAAGASASADPTTASGTSPSAGTSASAEETAVPASDRTAAAEIYRHLANRDAQFTVNAPSSLFGKGIPLSTEAMQQDDYLQFTVDTVKVKEANDGRNDALTYQVTYRETAAQSQYVQTKVKAVLANLLTPGMNDFQKEKAIHDYVVTHLSYDESYQPASYTAYGALQNGKAVCEGYALLMYAMMKDAGLTARIYEGNADNGVIRESHAWNGVLLDGKWYDVDATWDDPVGSSPGEVNYLYYNVTDQQLHNDHTWTKRYPAADTDFIQTLKTQIVQDPGRAAFYQSLLDQLTPWQVTAGTASSAAQLAQFVQAALQQHESSVTIRYAGSLNQANAAFESLNQSFSLSTGYPNQMQAYPNGATTVMRINLKYLL